MAVRWHQARNVPTRLVVRASQFPHPVVISNVLDARLNCQSEDINHRTIVRTLGPLEEDHEMNRHSGPIGSLTAVIYLSCS